MSGRLRDSDWLLGVLSDGKPHSHAELMRRSMDERGHGFTPHSRAADLRKLGHDVQVQVWRANGRAHSSYRLVLRVESQSPSLPTGGHSCGSTGQTVAPSSQPTTTGVSPSASRPDADSAGVGCVDGDGQLALLDPPTRGAYDEVAA
jgi:hypothetical protein